MDTRGRHLLVEYFGCDPRVLDDLAAIEALMRLAAEAANATVLASVFHPFVPQGASGVVVLAESHLSIHTWPEHAYAAVDFYTCGDGLPERAHEVLRHGLEAARAEVLVVERGMLPSNGTRPSMRVRSHYAEGDEPASDPAERVDR